MSPFDQVQLHDIIGPVPPEPDHGWGALFIAAAAGIATVLIAHYLRQVLNLSFFAGLKRARDPDLCQLRRRLRCQEKEDRAVEPVDLDHWWTLLERSLNRRRWIGELPMSLEETAAAIKVANSMNQATKADLLKLIALLDKSKFSGGLNPEQLEQARDLFDAILDSVESRAQR